MEDNSIFRVSAFGEEAAGIIPEIAALDFGVGKKIRTFEDPAELLNDTNEADAGETSPTPREIEQTMPTDMLIVLVSGEVDKAIPYCREHHNNGTLTLVLTDKTRPELNDVCDAYLTVNVENMPTCVKTILEPVVLSGRVDTDFYDLARTLYNAGKVTISFAEAIGEDRVLQAIHFLAGRIHGNPRRVLLAIYYNKSSESPLKSAELKPVSEFVKMFGDDCDVTWGFYYDSTILREAVRITIIAAK